MVLTFGSGAMLELPPPDPGIAPGVKGEPAELEPEGMLEGVKGELI